MIRALALLFLLAGCGALEPQTPPPPRYEIQLHSAESWARYYTRIGLGTVLPLAQYPQYGEDVRDHCDFLTSVTKRSWIPLGMSKERGYRLCYETGPFTEREARVMCNRLVMRVQANGGDKVVCEADPANPPPSQEQLNREYERLSSTGRSTPWGSV
jgi:hypothetical protein